MNITLWLHLLAASIWFGGMVFSLFCLRPALASQPPAVKVSLQVEVLKRFFVIVWVCIATLLLTGLHLYGKLGSVSAPFYAQVMAVLGIAMMLIFAHLYFAPFKHLKAAQTATDWPSAAKALNTIRWMITANCALAFVVIAAVRLLR
jgi:uncharacterized membrane protein